MVEVKGDLFQEVQKLMEEAEQREGVAQMGVQAFLLGQEAQQLAGLKLP